MDKCKNCANFRPNVEASDELSPRVSSDGRCEITQKDCRTNDNCSCDGYEKRRR